jgi:murein DD-endopeptidase MepM/ murein hydrolase activator NlpD
MRFLIILCIIFWGSSAWAQEPKYKKNNIKIRNNPPKKNPPKTVKKTPPDTTKAQQPQDTVKKEEIPFNPIRVPNIPSERITDIDTSVTSVVQVSEYLKIDCVWVKAADYYSVWSSSYINPYRKDPAYFKDTVHLMLYDEVRNQLWAKPLDDILLTSHFGPRWGRMHQGIDLNLKMGTPIYSIFDGIVRIATFGSGYGYHVVVRHSNGLETLYAHMSKLSVQVGQVVRAGELLGLGGSTGWSTGPHLHLEVLYAGSAFNPLFILEVNPKSEIPFVRSKFFDLTPSHFRHIGTVVKKDFYHTVKAGESLHSIARRYGTNVVYLARMNGLTTNTVLRVGQRIRLK